MKLERLNLSFNHLHGNVPLSLGKLTSLHILNLSNNHLEGQIPSPFSKFPLSSFLGNGQLRGPPLTPCLGPIIREKKPLSNTAVAGVIVAIVFSSTLICLGLLYVMLRIWCNWKKVSVSSSEAGLEHKREEEKWVYREATGRDFEYWKVNSSQEKQISSTACIFQLKVDTETVDHSF